LPAEVDTVASDELVIAGERIDSRLLVGTGKFSDSGTMVAAIRASEARIVTVALRRCHPGHPSDDLLGKLAEVPGLIIMPNTSGARDAREAIRAAHLGRELSGSRFVKVEIHPNPHHLMPDAIETYEASRVLASEGFTVMPYIPPDPVLAKRLEDVGCASVMPLGSAIGSGHGLAALELIRLIVRDASVPVIVDAGLRAPSEAAAALELGCDAVLVNTAIAVAQAPAAMASAFALAVKAGRAAFHAGLMSRRNTAQASSPLTEFLTERT